MEGKCKWVVMHDVGSKKPRAYMKNGEISSVGWDIYEDCQWSFDELHRIFKLVGTYIQSDRISNWRCGEYLDYKLYDEEFAKKYRKPEWKIITTGCWWWKEELKVWKDGDYLLKDGVRKEFTMTGDIIITIDKE